MSTTKLAALRELEASLRQIKADYDRAAGGEDDQQDHLPPATLSLLAVAEFVKQMPGWRGLDFGLNMLLDVLWEAHEGKTPKWLTNSRVGRREVPLKRTVPRAYCAGVMEFLMQNGRSREEAACFVLRHLPSHAAQLIAGPNRTWHSVAGWRDQLSGPEDPKRKYEQRSYRAMLKFLASQDGPVDERAQRTLDIVAKLPAVSD